MNCPYFLQVQTLSSVGLLRSQFWKIKNYPHVLPFCIVATNLQKAVVLICQSLFMFRTFLPELNAAGFMYFA